MFDVDVLNYKNLFDFKKYFQLFYCDQNTMKWFLSSDISSNALDE